MSQLDSARADNVQRGVFVEKPRANIYTALLALSLVAIIIGCICLHAEMTTYGYDFKAQSAKAAGT